MNKLRGMEKKSVGRDCRDGFRNTWGDEIVRRKLAEVEIEKGINSGYCRGGCRKNCVVENGEDLY